MRAPGRTREPIINSADVGVSKRAASTIATLILATGGGPAAALAEPTDIPAAIAAPTPVAGTDGRGDLHAERLLAADRRLAAERPSRAAAHPAAPAKPAARKEAARPKPRPAATPAPVRPAAAGQAGTIIGYALAQLGKPYRWAASGPDAFDCSGLAMAAYARAGIKIPHHTGAILRLGSRVSRSQLRPGDLVFPSGHHVGIYLGGGKMVHAPQTGDVVRVADLYAFYTGLRIG